MVRAVRGLWWLIGLLLAGATAAGAIPVHGTTSPPASWHACGRQHGQTVYCVPPR